MAKKKDIPALVPKNEKGQFLPGQSGYPAAMFKPGQSGNPNGRPAGTRSLSTILREMLDEEVEIEVGGVKTGEKKKLSDILIRKLISKASRGDGDVRAIQEIFDRVDGKPKENEGQPTEMIITVKRKE